jgi:hypothetical protein
MVIINQGLIQLIFILTNMTYLYFYCVEGYNDKGQLITKQSGIVEYWHKVVDEDDFDVVTDLIKDRITTVSSKLLLTSFNYLGKR